MFKAIKNKIDFSKQEEEILTLWDQINAFERSINERDKNNTFYFYDGPPFATGLPHYGHLLASTIKDVVPRFQTMKGKRVERRFGWDCHGLPVEFEVEKELGLKGKVDIEDYGVDNFNEKCRSIVLRYSEEWKRTIRRLGRWVDMENDYKTMDTDFMESIWWVFKELFDKGLIYESHKIVAYSPRLGTPLSNFEVNLGYQDTQDPAVTIKFKLKGETNKYFLAWTTTPWTLPSNLALTVNPELTYVTIEHEGEKLILAEALLGAVFKKEEPKILERHLGKDLEGIEYEPLFDYFAELSKEGCFKVTLGNYVTTEAGTGIVHTAPSFGEDDFQTGKKYLLPHVFPINDAGEFTGEAPDLEGMFFKDADKKVIKLLKEKNLLFKHETLMHSYPFCWRSGAPLMYRTIGSWFLDVEKIKENMIANNQQVHWSPEHIKNGRMGKWLEGAREWAISRNRYWGNPIPVWVCPGCEARKCIGSKKELEELTGAKVEDLHSHKIDHLGIACDHCDSQMKRTPEVLDCWFESGAMPYGQNHYPFENKEAFDGNFPADFISEGIDQTRGWFYTLAVLSSALFNKPAFKSCVVSGMLLAEDGKKMSKSLKNYPDPWDMLNKYGADVIRLYMLNSGAIRADELKFAESGLQETLRGIFIPLWNVLSFFTTYAEIDKWEPTEAPTLENPLDLWIISRLHHLAEEVETQMDSFDLNKSVAPFVGFIDMLTNWYVRRSRRRFWKSGDGADKTAAYHTLYTVLLELSKITAPFIPFLSESIYQVLKGEQDTDSVHLCLFPVADQGKINKDLEAEMDLVLQAVNMGRAIRARQQLKIRQPLASVTLVTKNKAAQGVLRDMADLITDELNVKELKISQNEEDLVHLSAKPNLKLLGPKLGKKLSKLKPLLEALTSAQIVEIQNGAKITLDVEGEPVEIGLEELFLERSEKEGIITMSEGDVTLAIDAHLTDELLAEGIAREFVNKVQQTRKDKDLNVEDRIHLAVFTSEKVTAILANFQDYITKETLCDKISFEAEAGEEFSQWDLNGNDCSFKLFLAV